MWSHWQRIAAEEVESILQGLPGPLQERARELPVTYEPFPHQDLESEGIAADTLGLFVGEAYADQGATASPLPAQIILFLENLADFVGDNEEAFRDEVRTTYLHELGHYLGLDEEDLADRGLD